VKRKYLLPRVDKSDVLFEFADELTVDTGLETYMLTADSSGLWVSCGPLADDVTHDPVGIFADLIGCTTSEVEPMLREHFAERLGKKSGESLEYAIGNALPGLAELATRNPTLKVPIKMSARLCKALRNGDARAASRSYFGDESSRSDGNAFADALVNGDQIDESRASMLALVEVGDLRREISGTPAFLHWVVLPAAISHITASISPRARVDFAATAIGTGRSRFSLVAASRCGITATGHDGAAAFHRVLSEVQRSNYAAPRTAVERLITGGPVAGLTVRKTPPLIRELKQLGDTTRTCLGNPAHPWLNRIVRGEVELMTLHNNQGEIVAMIALGLTGEIREAKTPGNGQVPDEILTALKVALEERR
jgi:hypothetical protein